MALVRRGSDQDDDADSRDVRGIDRDAVAAARDQEADYRNHDAETLDDLSTDWDQDTRDQLHQQTVGRARSARADTARAEEYTKALKDRDFSALEAIVEQAAIDQEMARTAAKMHQLKLTELLDRASDDRDHARGDRAAARHDREASKAERDRAAQDRADAAADRAQAQREHEQAGTDRQTHHS